MSAVFVQVTLWEREVADWYVRLEIIHYNNIKILFDEDLQGVLERYGHLTPGDVGHSCL